MRDLEKEEEEEAEEKNSIAFGTESICTIIEHYFWECVERWQERRGKGDKVTRQKGLSKNTRQKGLSLRGDGRNAANDAPNMLLS